MYMYMYMYICIYVYMYIRVYVYMYICIYVYMYICIYVYMYICIYVYMYICIYVYMYICIYVYMYICIYVYMYICIYVYMYMHMYMHMCIYMYICITRVLDRAHSALQQPRASIAHFLPAIRKSTAKRQRPVVADDANENKESSSDLPGQMSILFVQTSGLPEPSFITATELIGDSALDTAEEQLPVVADPPFCSIFCWAVDLIRCSLTCKPAPCYLSLQLSLQSLWNSWCTGLSKDLLKLRLYAGSRFEE